MKLKCGNCGHKYDGSITKTMTNGWIGRCPECGMLHPVTLPAGRLVIAFADDRDPERDTEHFTDDFTGKDILHYFAFDTPDDLLKGWEEIAKNPCGMWYWVLDGDRCICSGACDPDDGVEILKPYFAANLGGMQ